MTTAEKRAELLPGGYGRSSFFVGKPPPRAVAGEGYLLRDETGAELIDVHNNFSVLLHGHAHPEITAAAVAAARRGACFGLPNAGELEHAEALLARVPWAQQVRYTNSGTEAVMTAVRVARAVTGRDRIVVLSPAYHGTADPVLVSSAATRGVPAGTLADVLTVAPDDVPGLRATVAEHGSQLAAIVLDLVPARAGNRPLEAGFVAAAQMLAADCGALLVVDEVISFRHGLGGVALSLYDLEPDLLVVGKLIGGGFPVGAVLGRAETMRVLDPAAPDALLHGGTFTANPVTMSAGRAALDLYDEAAVARLEALGARAQERLGAVARAHGWDVVGHGSVVRLAPQADDDAARTRLWWEAYRDGVLLSPSGVLSLSTPMDDGVVDEIAARLDASLERLSG
ncbi:MAG: aminotransferase class III-fold pyridoxal phosphate-dependent enzyme [Actinobacteria bacterium]|nr:aminotransferase class III-fold pyridoxal phosphate-dependent enzyme [Actinomycetota bacterium]